MYRSVFFVVALAVASSVGVIFGFLLNEYYQVEKEVLINKSITHQLQTEQILESFTKMLISHRLSKKVNDIQTPEDLELLKTEFSNKLISDKNAFFEKVEDARESTGNPKAHSELKKTAESLDEFMDTYAP